MITQPLIGGFLTTYAIILSLSAALGLGLSSWLSGDDKNFSLDAGLGVLLISLLGARIGFIIRNLPYFIDQPGEIPQLWLGGLSWPGALIAAGAAILGVHLIWKEPLGELADSYLPLLGVLSMAIWLTGWGAGIGYGPQVSGWFGILVKDSFGMTLKRFPLPIIGATLSGLWIAGTILFPLKRKRKPGFRAAIGVGGIALINGIISIFRIDPAPLFGGFRWESWFSLGFLLAVTAYLFLQKENS